MATTSPKKVSVSELKTFIEAVDFAADVDEWIPSKRQWLRIREMINGLEATMPAPIHPQAVYHPIPSGPIQMAPSAFGPGATPIAQMPPGIPIASGAPNMAVRTPDIDTSNGTYQSSFAG